MKRTLILLANWFVLLTMPLWVGPVLWLVIVKDAIRDKAGVRKILSGKKFAWVR